MMGPFRKGQRVRSVENGRRGKFVRYMTSDDGQRTVLFVLWDGYTAPWGHAADEIEAE